MTKGAGARDYFRGTLEERLEHYTDKSGDCWLWTGTQRKGYGLVWCGPGIGQREAHIVTWELENDGLGSAQGWVVRHTCDTPLCRKPSHLFIGTQADNVHDALDRARRNPSPDFRRGHLRPDEVLEIRRLHSEGLNNAQIARMFGTTRSTISRVVRGLVFDNPQGEDRKLEPGRKARGSKQGSSKLSEEQVGIIKSALRDGVSQAELAQIFDISGATISNINTGKSWTHVP